MNRIYLAGILAAGAALAAVSAIDPAPAQAVAKPTIGGCGGWSTALSKDKVRLEARRACYAQVGPIAAAEIAKVDAALAKLTPKPTPTPSPTPTPTPAVTVWSVCAAEGQTCRSEKPSRVRFGNPAAQKWVEKASTGSIECTNDVFTDPIVGVVKQCQTSGTPIAQPVVTPPVVTPTPTPTPVPGAAQRPFQLGINLVSGVYWSGEQVFANLATSDEWPAEFSPDDLGGIIIPAGRTARRLLHPPVVVLNHSAKVDVVCTWQGGAQGFLDGMHRGTKPWNMVPGRLEFEWNGLAPDAGNNTWIDFRNGNVSALDCREKGVDPKQVFGSEFVDSIKPYSVLRNLDISPANGNPAASQIVWDTRTRPGSIDQLRNGHVSYELFVDLNNANKSSPWFTLPYNASPAYLRSFAQMVHDRLDPSLPVYAELSNEVWNPIFGANTEARREGVAAKLNDNEWIAGHLAYAAKFKAAMAVMSEVFKDRPGQLVRVYGAWSGSSWHTSLAFDDGKIAGSVDAVAIAPYFGHDLGTQLNGVTDRTQRVAALDASVTKAIGEMKAQKALTNRYGVRLIAYEAGQHIIGGDAMAALNRDPAMYDAYKRYIGAWRDEVGDLMVIYNTTGGIGQFGAWGIREYAGQPLSQTPKRRAVLEMAPAR